MLRRLHLSQSRIISHHHHQVRFFNYNNIFTTADHARSLSNPEQFWLEKAESGIDFFEKGKQILPKQAKTIEEILSSNNETEYFAWFRDYKLNFSYNCLDRHIFNGLGNQVAIYYDSAVTGERKSLTYQKLFDEVNILARVLSENLGVKKGDVVIIYMPNSSRALTAMLACSRIGAIHSVVFGGFAAPELAKRVEQSGAKVILTCSGGLEGNHNRSTFIDYALLVEDALKNHIPKDQIQHVLFHQRRAHPVFLENAIDDLSSRFLGTGKSWRGLVQATKQRLALAWNEKKSASSAIELTRNQLATQSGNPFYFPPVVVEGSHPLYILYTSGTTAGKASTGKPVVHDTAGSAVMLHSTMSHVFGCDQGDTVAALSDVGWVVGHSYSCYGPLLKGCSTVIFEGKPTNTPDPGTYFRLIQDYRVNMMFTAPTAFRAIRASDPDGKFRNKYDFSSLRIFFIAGERSDPSTIEWCQKIFHHRVPVIDNWWQTETGAPICSAPRDTSTKLPSVVVGSCGVQVPGWNLLQVLQGVDSNSVLAAANKRQNDDDEPSPSSNNNKTHAGGEKESVGDLVAKFPLPPGCLTSLWKRPGDLTSIYIQQDKKKGNASSSAFYYSSFDVGRIDSSTGFVHVMSRSDDVLNVAAHRLSTGQLEQSLSAASFTAESAVVGRPCELKGQRPVAFVVLKDGVLPNSLSVEERKQEIKRLERELNQKLRSDVGAIATSEIIVVPKLPKTRSGKVLRKLLREMVAGVERDQLSVAPTIEDVKNVDVLYALVLKHLQN